MNFEQIDKETLVNANYCYFDTAAAAPPPLPVLNAVKTYLDQTAELGIYLPSLRKRVYQDLELTRAKMAAFIGASTEEIAFTKNGTESICLVAQGIDWKQGDEILIPDTEMLSNISVWYSLEKRYQVKVIRVPANSEGLIEPQILVNYFTKKTRLLSFVALSNVTGAVQPIQAICQLAKAHGILTHINASQALGVLPIEVDQYPCNFLSACARKALRAIEGSGILYVKKDRISELTPCLMGWWNSTCEQGELSFPDTAKRFEAGCPNVPAIYSLDAALDYASQIGLTAIYERVRHLTDYALEKLGSIEGFGLYGPTNSQNRLGIIPFNIDGINPYDLVKLLEQKKVIIEAGHFMAYSILKNYHIDAMARISLHYFNSEQQIDTLINFIKQIKRGNL